MAKPKVRKKRTTDSEHPYPRYPNLVAGLHVTHPDQVWVGDITYVRLGSGFVYLAVIPERSRTFGYGCLHAFHPWVALKPKSGGEPNLRSFAKGAG